MTSEDFQNFVECASIGIAFSVVVGFVAILCIGLI